MIYMADLCKSEWKTNKKKKHNILNITMYIQMAHSEASTKQIAKKLHKCSTSQVLVASQQQNNYNKQMIVDMLNSFTSSNMVLVSIVMGKREV